jgi:putative SOS response-associated peptidase YedK
MSAQSLVDVRENLPEVTARLFTCCIITTAANDLVQPYHDRMPAILRPEDDAK